MVAVLTIIALVFTALSGAVLLSRKLNGEDKYVSPFECGCPPFKSDKPFHINIRQAVLFLTLDAIVVIIVSISAIKFI